METGSNIVMIQYSEGNQSNFIYKYVRLTVDYIKAHD